MNYYYKKLRTSIRKLDTFRALYVVWAYYQHLVNKKPFARDVQVNPSYLNADSIQKRRWISEWDLENLCREIIVHSGYYNTSLSLERASHLSSIINKSKDVVEFNARNDEDSIHYTLFKIAHQQFSFQDELPATSSFITRFAKILSSTEIKTLILKKFGLDYKKILILGGAFYGNFLTGFSSKKEILKNVDLSEIEDEDVRLFQDHFIRDFDTVKEHMQKFDSSSNYSFNFNQIRQYPLLFFRDRLICPIPNLILCRVTNVLFYDLVGETHFGRFWGESFQSYVGEVLEKSNSEHKFCIHREESYQNDEKRTVDWIIDDDDITILIECKAKGVNLVSRTGMSAANLEEELKVLASDVVQTYHNLLAYQRNQYSNLKYDGEKKILPLVVTLHNWYLFGHWFERLSFYIEEEFRKEGLDSNLLMKYPYLVCSIREFELLSQVFNNFGLLEPTEALVFDERMADSFFLPKLNEFCDRGDLVLKENLFDEDFEALFNL